MEFTCAMNYVSSDFIYCKKLLVMQPISCTWCIVFNYLILTRISTLQHNSFHIYATRVNTEYLVSLIKASVSIKIESVLEASDNCNTCILNFVNFFHLLAILLSAGLVCPLCIMFCQSLWECFVTSPHACHASLLHHWPLTASNNSVNPQPGELGASHGGYSSALVFSRVTTDYLWPPRVLPDNSDGILCLRAEPPDLSPTFYEDVLWRTSDQHWAEKSIAMTFVIVQRRKTCTIFNNHLIRPAILQWLEIKNYLGSLMGK